MSGFHKNAFGAVSVVALFAGASMALAEGQRSLSAHEHGAGALDVAVEGNTLAMSLRAPGADIVGFEHEAKSDEDRASVNAAIGLLNDAQSVFALPEDAGCTLTSVSAALETEDNEEHGDEHTEHDEKHDDEHAEHEEKHDDEHHDEHADEEGEHSEFHADYVFECTDPDQINRIDLVYFEQFPNALELDVQVVTPAGAGAAEVERDNPVLDMAGMF